MTDAEFRKLLKDRDKAWKQMNFTTALCALPDDDRQRMEDASRAFRKCDRAITQHLVASGPRVLDGIEYRASADKLNFLALKPGKFVAAFGEHSAFTPTSIRRLVGA